MRVRLRRQRLLAFLAQSPLSQNHWALKLGLSRGHWSEIVNGKHPYPSPRTRERMLEVLGLPFEELFEIEAGIPSWADTDFRRAIADRYLIDTELGQGGMGAVYLARDTRHGRIVAVKVIAPEAVSGIGITQFLREIATVAHLQHPHILPLYDSGEAAGHPFYVMPWIRGGSLRARLEAAVRLPAEEAVALTAGVAAALQHAHEQRVLHCDVKPENILLDGTHPYVMDFGVARKLHTEVLPWTLRRELDLSAGTPAYVSPEQASGEKELDTRSDVYSLACVLYEMLSGRPPFAGPTTQAVVSRRFVSPPPPLREFAPEIPAPLVRAVERGMALEPRQRPDTPAEFAAAVAASARPASGLLGRLSLAFTRGASRLGRPRRSVRFPLGSVLMESLWQDLRYAVRALRKSPAFTLVAVLTLALGIGANTAIFSVVRGLLLKPLPHRDGDRLMYVRHSADGPGRSNLTFSVPEVRDLRIGARSLAGIAEYSSWSGILQREDGSGRIALGLVTGNFFEVMGLSPILGRLTRPGDDGPGAAPVMVLTREFWLRRFGGDSAIVGRQVRMDDRSVTVIGVVQPAPHFPTRVDAYTNMVFSAHHLSAFMTESRTHRMTEVVARLAPGVTPEQAGTEVASVYARMQRDWKEAYDAGSNYRVAVIPFRDVLGERARLTLWLLMGAAGFVLIISAANVANLTLMRGVRRAHELVTRAALGAGVPRLRRLLLAENVLLALLGGGLGVLIAVGGLGLLTSFAERYSPRASEIRLDYMVLGFALTVSAGLALLLSFVATLPEEGTLSAWISAGGRRLAGGRRRSRLQRALVVVQVAVSVVLLAGAGLLTRTLLRLSEVDSGLETEEVLTMDVPLLIRGSDSQAVVAARSRAELLRLEIGALPGVAQVGFGSAPLRRSNIWFDVRAEGRPDEPGQGRPSAELRFAGPGYFRAAGIPVLGGREFTAADREGFGPVMIVNQAFADRLFPGVDPVGRRIALLDVVRFTWGEWRTIIGVVGNTRDGGLDSTPHPAVFVPQRGDLASGMVIRAERDAAALIPSVTGIVRRIAPNAPIEQVATISQLRDESVSPRRLNAALIASFSLLALIIAAVGIAGVLAFSVAARTGEIGIRMSLGADAGRVLRMILGEGSVLLGVGLVLGVAGAAAFAGVIRGLLYGVPPRDPVTFAAVTVTMGAIGLGACWIPARRAARVDPAIAMRAE